MNLIHEFHLLAILLGRSPMVRTPNPPTSSDVQRWQRWGPVLQDSGRWGIVFMMAMISVWFFLAGQGLLSLPKHRWVYVLLIMAFPALTGLREMGAVMARQATVLSRETYRQLLVRSQNFMVFQDYRHVVETNHQRRLNQIDLKIFERLVQGWDGPYTYTPSPEDEAAHLLFQIRHHLPKQVFS